MGRSSKLELARIKVELKNLLEHVLLDGGILLFLGYYT